MNSPSPRPARRVRLPSIAFAMAALACQALSSPAAAQTAGAALAPEDMFQGLRYRSVGPSRGGRVTAVAGHRDHPFTFYMGGTGGGVWKTDDYGTTWRPISDGYFATGSIGSIRVAPSNSRIVYVGTGSDGIRSNVILGRGAYRSDDAGETWRPIGLSAMGQIGALEIHPRNSDVALAAALGNPWAKSRDRGVYKTIDGGKMWKQVLFTSDSVGAIDLDFNAANPDEIYAAMWRGERKPWTIISGMQAAGREDGIWKSTDGGETWRIVTQGLPTGLIGKIDLAVTPADPRRVYALVETTDPDEGLYRSDDNGETWRLASNQEGLMERPFYYTNVDADPKNADVVWVNNENFFKSSDGGATWQDVSTPHGDNHDLWINPDNPDIMVQSNDGGANVTLDGGRTWSTQYNQPTAELYQVYVDDRFPYWLYAGQQDNSTIMVPSNPPEDASPGGHTALWRDVGGCETGPAVPKPGNPDIVYSNCKGRFGRYSHGTGQEKQYYVGYGNLYGANPKDLPYRFQRTVPIEVSPHDPNTVYHGSQFVHRTRDEGVTWETISPDLTAFRPERQVASGTPITRDITGEEHYSVVYAIEESPVQAGVIWSGANDGPVQVTRDHGRTWKNVTPRDMPPEGRIQTIDASPHKAGKAYFAGYRTLLGDFRPFIYRTEDFGETWTLLTPGNNGIPADFPTRAIREDPEREGLLYAGTEYGMFISLDDGRSWQPFQRNLPVTPITDIKVVRGDLVLSTMGRSFWVMDNLGAVREWSSAVASAGAHLFKPRDAYRGPGAGGGFGGGRTPDQPEWGPNGAALDYWLGKDAQSATLEILDGSGKVIRAYRSGGRSPTQQTGQGGRGQPQAAPTLETTRGMHRVAWDLTVTVEGAGRAVPKAVPGAYQARLTVDGQAITQPLTVKLDPRVAADGVTVADLQAQYDLALRILAAMADTRETIQKVDGAMQRAAAGGDVRSQLDEIQRALVTDRSESSYPQPMLADQFQYLYSNMVGTEQRPSGEMTQRLETLRAELEEHKARLERLLRTIA
ncbi:MAG: hypothetical protein Q8N53_02480 [Longimicrobiales bacterium]|nr:hypothetical protein [Longimicrobiales bacterium]